MNKNVGTAPGTNRPHVYPVVSRSIPGSDNKRAFYHSVLCCHEGCREELLIKSHRGTALDTAQIIQTARQKGWVADKHGFALCFIHAKRKPKADGPKLSPKQKRAAFLRIRMEEEAENLLARQREADYINGHRSQPVIITPIEEKETEVEPVVISREVTTPPPSPDLKVRQRILEILDEYYDKREQSYVGAETDETIAKRLNVPRKWISDIREMFFGPEGNQVNEILRSEVAEYIDKCSAVVRDALEVAQRSEELEKFGRKLQEKVGVPLPPKR